MTKKTSPKKSDAVVERSLAKYAKNVRVFLVTRTKSFPSWARTNKRKLLKLSGIFLGATLVLLFVVHKTSLHHKVDPLGYLIVRTRMAFAGDPVEEANLHLTLSEDNLREYVRLTESDILNTHRYELVDEMIAYNLEAISYMDEAKQGGTDIKEIQLVKRLCDLLGEQEKVLSEAYLEFEELHTFASDLEDRVEAGATLEDALGQVKLNLSEAMTW